MRNFFEKNVKKLTALLVMLMVSGFGGAGAILLSKPSVVSASDNIITRIEVFRNDTQDELDERRREREATMTQAQAAADMVSSLADEKYSLQGELAELNDLSEEQREQYEIIAAQLAAALVAKAEALDAYIQAQDNLAQTQETFQERLSVMFEYQNKSTLEVLLESDSLAGFFTNMEIITLIADADAQAVEDMEVALDDAEAQQEIALAEADEMQEIADEKQAQLDELEARIGVTTAALEDVSTQLDSWTAQENSLEALSASLDSQIVALQNQLAAEQAASAALTAAATTTTTTTTAATTAAQETTQTGSEADATEATTTETTASTTTVSEETTPTPTPVPTVDTSGISLSWPTWNHTITSYFGYRVHPVYGDTRYHSGIDIGASFGDTIMAAASGTVIYVETPVPGQNYGGTGYGNYMIIDHGNGVTTLYGHCQNVYVTTGQYVSAGEAIGTVGSTGTSTGSHLHFEVRVNGTRVDPLGCLP